MGVCGLLDYISRTPKARQKVSLREAALEVREKSSKEPKLLCDYFSTVYWLLSSCDHALIKQEQQSPYSILHGGDLKEYSSTIWKFVTALRELDVEPVFFVDGAPGSNLEEFQWKRTVWQGRYLQKMKRCADVQQVCNGNQDFLCVHCMLWEAASLQVQSTLRSAGVQLVYCLGEADSQLLEYHRTHNEESLGILSSDTDFAIAPGSVLYHTSLIDKDLVTELVSRKLDPPPDITCEVITPQSVAMSLEIDEAQLLDLSILCGNDFTRELNIILMPWAALGLTSTKVKDVAVWLQTESTPLLENKEVKGFFAQHPQYKLAVKHSYHVYCGKDGVEAEPDLSCSTLVNYIKEEVQGGRMAPPILSVLNGIYWKTVIVAPITLGQPSFNEHTLSLRKCLYAILGRREVREYGRTGTQIFTESVVDLGPQFVGINSLQILRSLRGFSVDKKLAILFHLVVGCKSFHSTRSINTLLTEGWRDFVDFEESLPSKAILVCSSLLLFEQANETLQPSPRISPCEIEAILVTCLLLSAGISPFQVPILPTARSVSVAMWFSHVLEQVYIAGSFLGLSSALEPPGTIFYPLACMPFLLVSSIVDDSSVEDQYGRSVADAFNVFSKVISLRPVLKLRAAILNQRHTLDLHHILHLFQSSLGQVTAMKEMLAPKCTLHSNAQSMLDISFDSEEGRRETNERASSLSRDTPEFELDMDFYASTSENTSEDVSSEAVVECNELSSTQEYVISEEYLYLSSQSQKEEVVDKQGTSSSETLEFHSNSGSPEPHLVPGKEHAGKETQSAEISVCSGAPQAVDGTSFGVDGDPQYTNHDDLPVMEHRQKILDLISSHQVVCIEGETGCGKSTMIPQFILDEALSSDPPKDCHILVTQPRRVAAMKLAERVAQVRGERLGQTVGYCIGGERHRSSSTQLTYCTVGYMLQALVHNPSSIDKYSHIVLDEIHERSSDTDFAMLVVRKLVAQLPTIKVVVMSATLQGDLLVRYFEEVFPFNQVAPPYFVGAKRYPVRWYFLDQLCSLVDTKRVNWHEQQLKAALSLQRQIQHPFEEKLKSAVVAKAEVTTFAKSVCTNVIVSQANLGESILVFLPGIAEIAQYYEDLIDELTSRNIVKYFSLFILHSQVPMDDQKEAFHAPPKGKVHVILATNIAESSVTLPKLRTVINFGVYRQVEYNSKRHISCLVRKWCSHASCAQRAGRAGRVFEGVAVHLFSKKFFDVVLSEYDPPEMSTAPLAKLVLQAKQIGAKLGVHSPSQFLSLAIEPPSLQQMEAALRDLASLGAIATTPGEEVSENAKITLLGRFSLSLPVDLVMSRLILLGILFGCPVDAIIMSAYVSLPLDVFSLPSRVVVKDDREYSWCLWNSMNLRFSYDGGVYSDPMAAVKLFKDWIHWRNAELGMLKTDAAGAGRSKTKRKMAKPPKVKSRFLLARLFSQSKGCAIRWERLLHFESLVSEIASRVLIHIPDTVMLHAELKKLAILASYQRAFRWSANGPPVLSQGRVRASTDQQDEDICKFDLVFCPDVDVLQALLVAAFSHQMLLGTHSYDCFLKKERVAVRKAMDAMRNAGLDHSRTLYMDKLRQANSFELQKLVNRVFPFDCYTQSAVVGDAGFIEFNPTFSNSPKTAIFRAHSCSGDKAVSNTQCSTPLPLSLYFFWQFGERRPFWHVEGVTAEFTKPKHSHALTWSRRSSEREFAVVNSWRNLTGLVTNMSSEQGEVFLSVASTIQGFDNRDMVSVKGITLLPRLALGPTAILMVLAFEPVTSSIGLKVDTVNHEVVAVELSSQVIELGCNLKSCLKGADIVRVNNLRAALSMALNALTPEGTIPMDVIGPIPQLLRSVLRQESSFNVVGTESQPCEGPAAPAPQLLSLRPTPPAIEEETGQQDSEISGGPILVRPEPLNVPVCKWDNGLSPCTSVCAESDSPSEAGQFQYYPPLQCSLVTARMKQQTKLEHTSTPVIFKPLETEMSSIPGFSPQTRAGDIMAHVDSHDDGQEEEEGAGASIDSGSDSSSASFKLSPHAKPFVPNKPSTVGVQEPLCAPANPPEGGLLGTVPPGLVPWSLDTLSKEVLRFRSIAQQGNPEDQNKVMGDPFQTLPLDSSSVSMGLAKTLSGLPPFPLHYGFAMPSSPAHDYFSPEGNLSCLDCHSLALQPHLEAQRLEAVNLTGEQLTNFRDNLRRKIRQQQHHRDVVLPGRTRDPKPNAASRRNKTCGPHLACKSRQQHASAHGQVSHDQLCRRDNSSCSAQRKGAHQFGQNKVDPIYQQPSPAIQARGPCTPMPRCPLGISTAGHIPSSQSPPKTPCELSIASSTNQKLPMNSPHSLNSPLLPNPILHVHPSTSLASLASTSLPMHPHGHLLSSPPTMALNSSAPSMISARSSGPDAVLPVDQAATKRGGVLPPPVQHTHTCTRAMLNAPFLGSPHPFARGRNYPVSMQQNAVPHSWGPSPPCYPRPHKPVYSCGETPPFKPCYTPLKTPRHRTPEWIRRVYKNYPHLPPAPGFPMRLPTVQAGRNSFGMPGTLPAHRSRNADPLQSIIPRPSRSRKPYPHKGTSEPCRLEMSLDEEQHLVAFIVKYLKQHGGEASFKFLCGQLYATYRQIYNIPYHVLPPDRQFFHRHSDTFCVFGSHAEGFVVQLGEENTGPSESIRSVPCPVVPQKHTLDSVDSKSSVEEIWKGQVLEKVKAFSKETHMQVERHYFDTGESSDTLDSVPTKPLGVEEGRTGTSAPRPSDPQCLSELSLELCLSDPVEVTCLPPACETYVVSDLISPAKGGDESVVKEPPVVVPVVAQEQEDTSGVEEHAYLTNTEAEGAVKCCHETARMEDEKEHPMASPSAVQEQERTNLLSEDSCMTDERVEANKEEEEGDECCHQTASMEQEKEHPLASPLGAQEQEGTSRLREDASMTDERSEANTEEEGDRECCHETASMEEEHPMASPSPAQEQEGANREHASMTKERSKANTEGQQSDEAGDERIAKGNPREEGEYSYEKGQVIGERPHSIGHVEGEGLQHTVGDKCVEHIQEEGTMVELEKKSDEEPMEKNSLELEMEMGEVPEEEWKEVWSSSASASEDTFSNSTGCEEFWDTYSVTGVDVEVSSSPDDASSFLQTTVTEEWPDSVEPWGTPPVEILHHCKGTAENQGSQILPTYLWEVLKPPGESRECCPTLDQSTQLQDFTFEGNSTLSDSTSTSPITRESHFGTVEPVGSLELDSNSKEEGHPSISPEVLSSASSPTARYELSGAQKGLSDKDDNSILETMENLFVELLKQHGGSMSFTDLIEQCRDYYPELSSQVPGVDFFTSRAHLFSVQEHPDSIQVMLASGMETAPSSLKRAEPSQGGSCSEAELEQRICGLLKTCNRWCRFTTLCQEYRRVYGVTMWWDHLAPKDFFLQRPKLFSTRNLRGWMWICRNPRTDTSHDQEKQMVMFCVRYLQRKRERVRFSTLGTEYRLAYALQRRNCWLGRQFFDKWPQIFAVHGGHVELTPAYRSDNCSDREIHLEQEIVRYLARNGPVCSLSAVTSDKKIDILCSISNIQLMPHFFEVRPNVFKISVADGCEELAKDWRISLVYDAPEYALSSSDKDNKPSSQSERTSPEAVQMKKRKRKRSTARQPLMSGVNREIADEYRGRDDVDERKPQSAPAGYRRGREGDTSAGKRKPRSAPAGRRRWTREDDWSKRRRDNSDRPRSSEVSRYPSRTFTTRQTS